MEEEENEGQQQNNQPQPSNLPNLQEEIGKIISNYLFEKNLSVPIEKEYKKIILKTNDILIDSDLLKTILSSSIIEKKEEHDYFCYTTQSCRFYISENIHAANDIDLNYTYLQSKSKENISSIYKYLSIFHELVKEKKMNLRETNFTRYNSDEIKVFAKFIFYCINRKDKIDFDNFIYIKYFDLNKMLDVIQRKQFPQKESKFLNLAKNFGEIFQIFDEIYDKSLFQEIYGEIIEFEKIENNKLFFSEKEEKLIIQIFIKKEFYKDIIDLIKKIKEHFKDIKIILFIDNSLNEFFTLLKEGFLSNLIIKNPENKNLLMLKDNRDLFIYCDNKIESSYQYIENHFKNIKDLFNDFFETLYLLFNKDAKMHKIKVESDFSIFSYYIKDKVMQNYFNINEYNEEKKYHSIYLYSKNSKLCYDIFKLENPDIYKYISLWQNYRNIKTITDNKNSLILINGYELTLKSIKIKQEIYYEKIILQVDIKDEKYEQEFKEALNKINIEFHTKNIYIVRDLKDYIDENKNFKTKKIDTYRKRGFDTLLPFYDYIYKKQPILNKKPIILQVSYFLSYDLEVHGLSNELDE